MKEKRKQMLTKRKQVQRERDIKGEKEDGIKHGGKLEEQTVKQHGGIQKDAHREDNGDDDNDDDGRQENNRTS